jgi:hypothetical protein
MHRLLAATLATMLSMAPFGARAADLVVWWEKGFSAQEDEAIAEMIAAFEQKSGKQVELARFPLVELPGMVVAALKAGQPPDFVLAYCFTLMYQSGLLTINSPISQTLSGTFQTSSIRMHSAGQGCSMRGRARRRSTVCRSAARGITSSSGKVCWSRRVSHSRISRRNGTDSGHFGATESSRPCARPWAARTSGASASRCRQRPPTAPSIFPNLWESMRQTT